MLSISPTDEALAAFYIAQSVDIDRYCKNAVHEDLQDDTPAIEMLVAHSRSLNRIEVVNGLYELAFIRLFENVPYLRRFRINGTHIVTSFVRFNSTALCTIVLTPLLIATISRGRRMSSWKADMEIFVTISPSTPCYWMGTHSSVFTLMFDQGSFSANRSFPLTAQATSRFWPVTTTLTSPLYVAAVRLEFLWYFTTVKDGASTAVYSDELGEIHTAKKFFVLALRHNPSDLPAPYPRARKGAMDPTGPVFWLRFWPEKDPEYFEEARLTDDHLLESFLDEFAAERNILSGFQVD